MNLGFKYPVNWFRGREDERTAPLRRVLRAARHTEFYCDWIPDNGLRSPWIVLQSLPPITPDLLPVCVGDVSRAARSRLRRPRICCPLKPPPPISVLLNGAAIGHHEAVAAPVGRLRELAAAHALPTLRYAVFPFTGPAYGELTAEDHDLFWSVFQVPIFEQYVGPDGEVLAAECEIHDGLHVIESRAILERVEGRVLLTSLVDERIPMLRWDIGPSEILEKTPCACGDASAKLRLRGGPLGCGRVSETRWVSGTRP